MSASEVRDEILSWMKNAPKLNGCAIPSDGERGVVTGLMNSALRLNSGMGEANTRRRMVLAWIFRDVLNKPMVSEISAKQLSDEMWYALIKWAEPVKDKDMGMWVARAGFNEQMVSCWQAIQAWEHEMNNQLGFTEE